jgi:putative flippase GtrA
VSGAGRPQSRLRREALRFAMIGSIGFLVDAAVLTGLVSGLGWGLYEARGVSFSLAVSVTWYLNRRFTFTERRSADRKREYARYVAVQIIGALINLGVYALVASGFPALAAYPVIPLAAGSSVAMLFNFLASRRFAFVASSVQSIPCASQPSSSRTSSPASSLPRS